MLRCTVCLSYHSNTEAVLFARLLSVFPQGQRRATASEVEPSFRNLSITSPALYQPIYAAAICSLTSLHRRNSMSARKNLRTVGNIGLIETGKKLQSYIVKSYTKLQSKLNSY